MPRERLAAHAGLVLDDRAPAYFDKILQVPLVLARRLFGVSYRELLEIFTRANWTPIPP